VELAKIFDVPLYVKSSFNNESGTLVTKEDEDMEKEVVSGVTYDKDQAKITVIRVPDKPGVAARIFTPLSERGIIVDMIIQNVSIDGHTDLTFTVHRKDAENVRDILTGIAKEIGAERVDCDGKIAKISIIGVGMKSHAGVATQMFAALAGEGINILMISTSEIKISCIIESKYTELAVRVLHDTFTLDQGK